MGHGKETPRQKMIGMMYLVLTALLALNVSAEVLNAFVLVDESLRKSYDNINKKSEGIYSEFDKAMEDPALKAKTQKWKTEADLVKEQTQELFNYIDSIKTLLVFTAEGEASPYLTGGEGEHAGEKYDPELLQAKGNLDVGGQVMVLEKRGIELKSKINSFDSTLVDVVIRTAPGGDTSRYASVIKGIQNSLKTDSIKGHDGLVPWEIGSFEGLPLAAVLTMLSKTQTDLRNAEADALNYLYGQIDASSFKFNKIEAIVNSESNYVLQNNKYQAEVFIAAADTTVTPEITVGGTNLPIKEGKGIYTGSTSTVGIKTWGGVIKLKHPVTGEIQEFPFKSQYQVGAPSLTVSPTKMNVFYIGVANPVDVSVSGIPADKVTASISNGSIVKKSGSSYEVRVKSVGKVSVSATVEVDGQRKSMGSREFRVKRVPDPVPKVGGLRGGSMKKNTLAAQSGVVADLENFDFDLRFNVVSFSVSATIKGFVEEERSTSARLTARQQNLIKKVAIGQKVYFDDVICVGPDGSRRNIGSIGFKVK